MSDIVERLRGLQNVSQFNAAGVLETYEATPTPLDMEAAAEIERLRAALAARTEECARVADDYEKRAFAAQPMAIEAGVAARHIADAIRALPSPPDSTEGGK